MGVGGRRSRVEPTEDWEQLALLCRWPEQLAYEEIRPLTLFGASVPERARETGSAERTLYRKVDRFEEEGMGGGARLAIGALPLHCHGRKPTIGGTDRGLLSSIFEFSDSIFGLLLYAAPR